MKFYPSQLELEAEIREAAPSLDMRSAAEVAARAFTWTPAGYVQHVPASEFWKLTESYAA